VYPKNPPGFFGYVPGCLNPVQVTLSKVTENAAMA